MSKLLYENKIGKIYDDILVFETIILSVSYVEQIKIKSKNHSYPKLLLKIKIPVPIPYKQVGIIKLC